MVNENNNVPRILRIRKDGTIVALDQKGDLNENLNEKTVTKEQEYREYGKPLFEDYINQKLSRYERNKGEYDDVNQEQDNARPDDYYTDRDKQREWEQKQELDNTKKKNKWLWGFLGLALIVIIICIASFCSRQDDVQSPNDGGNKPKQNKLTMTVVQQTK